MEIVNSQTHILFKQTSNERLSSLGMKMLKQLNNRNVLDVALIELDGSEKLICGTDGLENMGVIGGQLAEHSIKELVVQLAKLIDICEENAFLNKEFILLDTDKVFFNPEDGSPKFIVLPVVSNSTGALGREWLEKLYEFLKNIVLGSEGGSDVSLSNLRETLRSIENNGTDSGELPINELIDLNKYLVENFSDCEGGSFAEDTLRGKNIEAKLDYQGKYGNFSMYIIKNEFVIGKDSSCDGKIPFNNTISRQHGKIYLENGECFYEDLGSSNHSRLNGMMLEAYTKAKLQNGDILVLADMEFTVEIVESVG